VPEQPATNPRSSRRPFWILAAVAALAIAFAVYFAYEAHEACAKAVTSASELAAKERELAELREREGARSATATKARVPSPPSGERSARVDNRAASSLPPGFPSVITPERMPGLGKIQRQSQLRMLRSIYDSLLTQLNLSPEQRDRFYDLQLAIDYPPAEAAGQIEQIRDSALSQIQDMLGPGEYQLYQSYRETREERELAEQFRQQLDSKLQMNDWQFAQLRDVLIQTSKQYPPDGNDHTASYQAAVAQAAQFLTPEQLNGFRDYLDTHQQILNDLVREIAVPLIKSLFSPGQ
jgi:hypothetical protein